ncbi:hypothetical protein AYO20_06980 [Fonsecaea nubica]|uniref:Sister chromatid cohesion protein Dcc1 n=1 Tax=Fonsecaea nubica TaxID=856822 RepID=A0A178CX17_9EURO|nr:hypothetical protein AYO20_06980 [Fonsecaea nubica]OAL33804.1 hypothetical protein AYO20_06980 [Fonsecaea nubica]
MSTTSSSQPLTFPPVPVSSMFPHQSLRLLELPPELLDDVETQIKNPSKRRKLWFKSSVDIGPPTLGQGQGQRLLQKGFGVGGIPSARDTEGKEGFLHLCTDDKIWAVKQVSTSNSVYITQTSYLSHGPRANDKGQDEGGYGDTSMAGADEDGDGPTLTKAAGSSTRGGGITTRAQVRNVLELIKVEPDEREIEGRVHELTPLHHDVDDDVDPLDRGRIGNGTRLNGSEGVSLSNVLDNIPAPTRLIRDVMRKSCIFQLPPPTAPKGEEDKKMVYLPTPTLLLRRWKDFLQQCTISGVNLEKNGHVLPGESLRAVLDGLAEAEETDTGRALALNVTLAILRRFTDEVADHGRDPQTCDVPSLLDMDPSSLDSISEEQFLNTKLKFNPSLSREVVGQWLLSSHARKRSLLVSNSSADSSPAQGGLVLRVDEFISEWTQLLPDSWAVNCDISGPVSSSVDGVSVARDDQGVQVLRFASPSSGVAGSLAKDAQAQSQSQSQKKRKWHEKFGAQRTAPVVKR